MLAGARIREFQDWPAGASPAEIGKRVVRPQRARRILEAHRKMMKSLLAYQSEEGVWRQLIDRPESWIETSSTGMFAFAMIPGVKQRWLDEQTYAGPARRSWLSLVNYIDARGDIANVCEGTLNDQQYYLNRKRNTGDLHGQAPVLWTAAELLRK